MDAFNAQFPNNSYSQFKYFDKALDRIISKVRQCIFQFKVCHIVNSNVNGMTISEITKYRKLLPLMRNFLNIPYNSPGQVSFIIILYNS